MTNSFGSQVFNYTGGRTSKRVYAPHGPQVYFGEPVAVRKMDANSTAVTATNTVSETVVATVTLPALTLASTGAARLTTFGTIGKNTGAGETVTLRVKMTDGTSTSTVLATSAVNLANSTSPHSWFLESMVLGKQPSVNRASGWLDISTPGAGGTLLPSTFSAVGFSTLGLDETSAWTVTVTAQMSAASTSFSVTRQVAVLEGVN